MDGKIMQQIREALVARWKQLETLHPNGDLSNQGDMLGAHAEIVDIAQALEQIGRDNSLKQAERRELLAIERALAKIASGNFGVCEDCGEEIPSRRLMVLPEARLCAHCQAYEERVNARTKYHASAR